MNGGEPSSHFYVSQRLRLRYHDWGNPDAPPLILLHGGRDHSRSWDWVIAGLRSRYHIVTPDLRGHGDSDWSSDGQYPMNSFLFDLAELIDQLGLAPVSLIGHSLGGNICLRYAGVYPDNVARLVAIEGLGFPGATAQPLDIRIREWVDHQRSLARRKPRRYRSVAEAEERMRQANPDLTVEQSRHLTIQGLNRNEDGSFGWKFDNYLYSISPVARDQFESPDLLSRIICPVLLARGAQSWASCPAADGLLSHFRNARAVTFEHAGHWLHHDQFGQFMHELTGFLDGNDDHRGGGMSE